MNKARQLYLIAYDISDHRRRAGALELCREYATGGQKSAHECWLSDAEHADLLANLCLFIDPERDRLFSLMLDARQRIDTFGIASLPLNPDSLIIV